MARPRTVWTDKLRDYKRHEIISCAEAGICRNLSMVSRHHRIPRQTVQMWIKEYEELASGLAAAWQGITTKADEQVPDFETFRKECFGHETYEHQRRWLQAAETNDLNLILVPPEHAKTMTMSIEYPVWRIVKDRNVRIIIISKSQVMSRKILMGIKKRLADHSMYSQANLKSVVRTWGPFAPAEGDRGRTPWTADMFYVQGIDSAEKDPTVEALGVGGQVYGARADLIILDDIATLKNQQSENEREKILEWIAQEVLTRLSDDGKLVIVGTRVHENDIYATLLSEDVEWAQDFSKIVMPAVGENDKTLWPEKWPLDKLISKRRNRMPTRQWNLVFQQNALGMPDAPFSLEALENAKDSSFGIGQVAPGVPVVMGVDPALEGTLAIVVVAVDRGTQERWLVDIVARDQVRHPDIVKHLIVENAQKYGARRCRIERNAMQGFLSKDFELRRRLTAVGCSVEEEYTNAQNKYDREWGVSSVAAQFDEGLWHLPAAHGSELKIRPLIEELAAWRPGAKIKQDRVMALWLADLSARSYTSYRPGLPTQNEDVPNWVRTRKIPRWIHGYSA